MYHFIYITNIPSFYKINLFNRIAEHRNILIIFTKNANDDRNADFYSGERNFNYVLLGNYYGIFKILKMLHILISNNYNKLILSGTNTILIWFAAFLSPKRKNCIAIESSIFESTTIGFKGFAKKIFFKRLTTVFASGSAQKELALTIGFKGLIKITKGVGIFNILPMPKFKKKKEIINFIYVGRLSEEKNLKLLINAFNKLPNLMLNIVGYGPQEKELKIIAENNIIFHGAIENNILHKYYQANDVFVLPSISEPWGLVVEEAFNNGLPVIVSNKVGCSTEIVEIDKNGLIFKLEDNNGLNNAILKMTNLSYYDSLRENIIKMNFETIAEEQVRCYL